MILVTILTMILVFIAAIFIGGYLVSAPTYSGPESDHFNGKTFMNPEGVKAKGFKEVTRWFFTRKPGKWEQVTEHSYSAKPADRITEGMRITFVNHSTFLIQVNGLNIITDPIWSERASPFTWAGPKRMRPPGIRFEDLPPIDLVIISHNHYDHLDIATMKRLAQEHKPKVITPLGVGMFLQEEQITMATDLDWWDEVTINDNVHIQAVPAQHFSGRGGIGDRDGTLWCGYVIKSKSGNIYFAGDTGYNNRTFKEIGEKAGPIKIALLPIGSYKPEWFMSPIHVSPEEAVKIHLDVKAEKSIAMHFGTFALGDDGQHEATKELQNALRKNGIATEDFEALQEGNFYESK